MKTASLNVTSVLGFILIMLLCACKKAVIPDMYKVPTTFEAVFEQFWYKMNRNYVYWDIDTTNWDNVYVKYAPIFKKLDLKNDDDVRKSVTLFKEITRTLIDGHYEISFLDKRIANTTVYPAMERKLSSADYHSPFSYDKLVKKYLDDGYISGYDNTSNNQLVYAASGRIKKSLLYFHCSYWGLKRSFYSNTNNDVKPVLRYFFSQLEQVQNESLKGIIIDVRGTPGGDIIDLDFFVGKLINQNMLLGYTRDKNGDGRLDYSVWKEAMIAAKAANKINCPIIVLGDAYSASLSETIIMLISALPGAQFIGETTWGATGPLSDSEIFNSGSFKVGDFLSVATSSSEFKYLNGHIFEGRGFAPCIPVPFDLRKLDAGIDTQIETAIALLKP